MNNIDPTSFIGLRDAEARDRKAADAARMHGDLRDAEIADALKRFWERLHDADRHIAYRTQGRAVVAARASLERMLLAIADDLRWECGPGTYALRSQTRAIVDALVSDAVNRALRG